MTRLGKTLKVLIGIRLKVQLTSFGKFSTFDMQFPRQVFKRAAKLAFHELSHLFDQFHFNETKCNMHF